MSNTWRAFMSPLHEDKLGVTNNNKQDISSFAISSRQTPSKKREPSFQGGQQNECPPTSKDKQHKQGILDEEENTEFREQIDDIQNKVVTLKKKMMSVSHEKYPGIVIPHHHQALSNLDGCQQISLQYPSTLNQQQISQQPFFQQKPIQQSHLHTAITDRSNCGQNFSESKRQKQQKISILPNEYTQHSTTRSTSNKVRSSLAKRNSFFDDLDNADLIINSDNVNPFYISEVVDQENSQNTLNVPQKRGISDINMPQKDEMNETEMLKRCMMKIQMKLEKEKQKRRELKMIIKQSSKSIGALRKDISNYQLDMQIVKQLTLNTTRAIEARTSSSTLRPSSTTAAQLSTVKKATCQHSSQKPSSKSKERLSNIVNVSINQQHPKNKTMDALKVFGRRKSKSVSNTLNDFSQKGFLNINITQLDSSDSSSDEMGAIQLKNNQNESPNFQYLQIQQPKYQKSEEETRVHSQQLQQQAIRKGKVRQISGVNNFSNELKQLQQSKKEKAQYYLSKMDKGKKKSLNLGDTSSSVSSSNMSALKFLQQNYQLQNQLKQKKSSKCSNKTIKPSNVSKQQVKQTTISILTDNIPTDVNPLNYVSSSASSIISSAAVSSQNVKKNINQNIISKKLNEFKKFKEALNSEITELKKEFESNDPLLASLNFEKLKERALKDKKVSLGLKEQTPQQYQNGNQRNNQTFSGQVKNLDDNKQNSNFQFLASDQYYDTDQIHSERVEDQDFQTPITHDRDIQSDANSQNVYQKFNINQSQSNNNLKTTNKIAFNESSEIGSIEKQKQIQSKIICKDILSTGDINQQPVSQSNQLIGTGQFLNNMIVTESYTGEEYLNSDRKSKKKQVQQEMQKQDYKLFQNQLNYFKMQETLNKHLKQYENQMIDKTPENVQLHQQQNKINQKQKNSQNIQQNKTTSNDPYIKNFSEPSSEASVKQLNSQLNQNQFNQQSKQQQIHNLIQQQQQQFFQQKLTQGQNNINYPQFTPNDIQTICQNVKITNSSHSNIPSEQNSEKTQPSNRKQQIINSSEKKVIEQYKKQLFPYCIDFNENDFMHNKNQNQLQKQKSQNNPVNSNEFLTNDSLLHKQPTQQDDQQQQNKQQISPPQQIIQQKINQPRQSEIQHENVNKQIKRQQSEALLNNLNQSNQQQSLLINQQQQQNSLQKINSNMAQTQQSQLFYKTPQNQANQNQVQNGNNSNSNDLNQNNQSSQDQINHNKHILSQQSLQQDQLAQFLLQSNSHLIQSGGFTDRQHNKSFSSQEKLYPSQDNLTSPLISLKSPDLNKSLLKKSGKNSFPSLPKSPNSVVNYYQDPINFSNITGVHSSINSESLNYTASIGTTPAKSVFYSTPMQNQNINNISSNNFSYANISSLQNNICNQNNSLNNNAIISQNNNLQNLSCLNNNNLAIYQNSQNPSNYNQAYSQNIEMKEEPLEYTTPQKK